MAACEQLTAVEAALDAGDGQRAGKLLEDHLHNAPDDARALHLLAKMLFDSGKGAVALSPAERSVRLDPGNASSWATLAAIELAMDRHTQARAALDGGYAVDANNPLLLALDAHLAHMQYRFDEADRLATLAIDRSGNHQAHIARAFSRLHRREWGRGWDDYAHGMGRMRWRDKQDYGLPEWHGQRGKVLVYAEQGLGDQLTYCAALDESVCDVVCHPKLLNLMDRSLPMSVYGDQFNHKLDWHPTAEYQVSMSGFMRYRCRTPERMRRQPFLNPHPIKQRQWQAVLDDLGQRRKIGLAWTGGMFKSHGWRSRSLTIADFGPLFALDADFISLEYKDPSRELDLLESTMGVKVHHYAWATETNDLDDFAALTACLDAIVCVPTTAYHVAGALGIPAHVVVHREPHFWEGLTDDVSPVWDSVRFYRRPQLGDDGAIKQACAALLP